MCVSSPDSPSRDVAVPWLLAPKAQFTTSLGHRQGLVETKNTSAESAIQVAGSPLLPRLSWEQKQGLSEQSTSPVELCRCSFGVGRIPLKNPEFAKHCIDISWWFFVSDRESTAKMA